MEVWRLGKHAAEDVLKHVADQSAYKAEDVKFLLNSDAIGVVVRAGYSEQSESKQDVATLRQQIHKILLADSLVADELTKLPMHLSRSLSMQLRLQLSGYSPV